MSCDLPSVSYMALYIISLHVIHTNSRTSTHWRLSEGKVQSAAAVIGDDSSASMGLYSSDSGPSSTDVIDDPMLSILTNKVVFNGGWKLEADPVCSEAECEKTAGSTKDSKNKKSTKNSDQPAAVKNNHTNQPKNLAKQTKETLDCGKPVNSTAFDHLRGISNRKNHPHIPEPEVALIFRKKGSRSSEIDMSELEKKLRKSKKEKPRSAQVYNQVGNFWRIKGNTQLSIECFRKALSISPNHPDVLLNMARVLFNLQYLDDAIFLTRRSLEMQPPDQNPWLQHFTLGEILKAYGHYQEATHHFRHTLDLKPGFHPAQAHLREMEVNPDGTVTYYTLFIILFLVMVVLCGILTSMEANFEEYGEMMKTQRHFNRAMAMRSIKLGMNSRLMRMKKYHC